MSDEVELSFQDIFQILKKNIVTIIVCTVLGMVFLTLISIYVIHPTFTSSAELIVQTKSGNNSNLQSDLNANLLLINTYKDMIQGRMVMDEVSSELRKKYDYYLSANQLKSMVQVSQSNSSMIFQIITTSDNAQKSANISNTVAMIFEETAAEVLNVNKVTITSKAEPDEKAIAPNVLMNGFVGMCVGFIMGIMIAFIVNLFDKTVKDEYYIKNVVELPIMGTFSVIPEIEHNSGRERIKVIRSENSSEFDDILFQFNRRGRDRL